jgi:ABC-2 type transport system ATP-binding protein
MVKTLEIKGLRKIYSNGFETLKGIELEIKPGDFFALLGPNGAGKSTTIGIITGLVSKTSGTVRVFGHDTDTEIEHRRVLGGYHDGWTGADVELSCRKRPKHTSSFFLFD